MFSIINNTPFFFNDRSDENLMSMDIEIEYTAGVTPEHPLASESRGNEKLCCLAL